MLRGLLVLAFISSTAWAAGPDAGLDAGRLDGGRADAGPDAGVDGGSRKASWRWAEGAWFDGGVSDLVHLFVGTQVEVRFPRRVVYTQCDDVRSFTLEPLAESYRFVGVQPGQTHCGFWYDRQPFPNRYVEVTVRP